MPIDLNTMTNREIEDVEEYVGRPIMGFLNRAFDAATKEREVKGKNEKTGEKFTEVEEYIDEDELMDRLPTKIMNALNCIMRRRAHPDFTMDKWADAVFGDDGSEPEDDAQSADPTAESSSDTVHILSEAPASSTESAKSETGETGNGSAPTLPSATSTPDTQSQPSAS